MSKRVAVLVVASLALGACSYVPTWARPSTVADRLLGRDPGPAAGNQFPTIGDVPRQAPATATPAQRQATVAALAADRANAQYTDEQLRQGGQIAAAPTAAAAPTPLVTQTPLAAPPPAPAPAPAAQVVQAAPRLGTNAGAPNLTVPDLAVPVPPVFQGGPQVTLGQPAAPQPIPPPAVAILPAPAPRAAAPAPAPTTAAPAPAPALVATPAAPIGPAAVPPPPDVQAPPAPVATPVVPAAPLPAPTQAQVNRVLPAQNAGGQDLLARTFAQMLLQSGQTVTVQSPLGGPPVPAVTPVALQRTLPPPAAANTPMLAAGLNIVPRAASGTTAPFNLAGAALGQASTIIFSHDSSSLSAEARRTIRTVADAYKARGGRVRVVGHASMRTRDMPVDRHVLTNFRVSVERAKAVADELLRLGVPPAALIVDAVGDAQPRFLEAMPAGEAGNRRVELYIEA